MEAAGITFAGVTLEAGDKPLGQVLGRPRLVRNDRFGDSKAHLRVIGVTSGLDAVAGMLDVRGQVVVFAHNTIRGVLEAGPVCISDGKFYKHTNDTLTPPRS